MADLETISITQGDDFDHALTFGDKGGRYILDGVITNSGANFASATAAFTASDIGTMITSVAGFWPDGTTISAVAGNGLSCTMSQPANSTETEVRAIVRAKDLTPWTFDSAVKRSISDDVVMFEFTTDETRRGVGVVLISLTHTQTAIITAGGIGDVQATHTGGRISTLGQFQVALIVDVTP